MRRGRPTGQHAALAVQRPTNRQASDLEPSIHGPDRHARVADQQRCAVPSRHRSQRPEEPEQQQVRQREEHLGNADTIVLLHHSFTLGSRRLRVTRDGDIGCRHMNSVGVSFEHPAGTAGGICKVADGDQI